MSQILVVFGATGQQGGSVIDYVVSDPELSKKFKLRGVTRDPSQPAALALKGKGVEIVNADINDDESIKQALQGAHTVFSMTANLPVPDAKAIEIRQGKAIADAAVAVGAQYLIFSAIPHASKISAGKYPVGFFDSKADIEDYIRGLPIKSAFFSPGSFMQNFAIFMSPRPVGDGTYVITNMVAPTAKFPWINIVGDAGKFIGAILAEPEKYETKVLSAASSLASLDEIAQIMSKATGKTVRYSQISESKYRTFVPPVLADDYVNMFLFLENCGYFGPQTKELVEWSAQQARGELTTVKDFLANNPPKLE